MRCRTRQYRSFLAPWNPDNVTVLASANANDAGIYAIGGVAGCFPDETYGLRLYAESLGHGSLQVERDQLPECVFPPCDPIPNDQVLVPKAFVLTADDSVKGDRIFEKDIKAIA